MIFGTHNSATGGKLIKWLRPFAWVINITSKCQDKSIDEQLNDGVKLFNLQVTYNGEKWYFSHGFALYKEDVIETIAKMKACATEKEPIYFLLYLDKSFWYVQDERAFTKLIADIKEQFCCSYFIMLYAWIEGTNKYLYKSENKLKWEEHYWILNLNKMNGKTWFDKLPLPKYHAKKYNQFYIANCLLQYLMLDFYDRK